MKLTLHASMTTFCFSILMSTSLAGPGTVSTAIEIPAAAKIIERLAPRHPRIIATTADFERLRKQAKSDPRTRGWLEKLRSKADQILEQKPSIYEIPDGKRLLSVSRRVLDRIYTLGFLFQLDGDERYLERAWKELQAAAKFPDWNPSHFLDTGEMTHAFAIGYDWFFHRWTAEQRAVLKKAMIEKGLTPALRSYEGKARYGWWVRAHHNWNQVCNGGIGIGALALGDEIPELAGTILNHGLNSILRAMAEYAPDGACPEGPGYWHYATRYTVYFLAALETALKTDYGIASMKGFSDTGLFPIYMTGTLGVTFNFADCGAGTIRAEEMFWLARRFNKPEYTWYERRMARPHPLDVLWHDPAAGAFDTADLALDKYFRRVEVASFRSSWNDPEGTFIGFKAGANSVNHSNLDLGSFVLDALGQRWAVDLGADNYNLPGYFSTGSTGKRWTYYRMRAESHNTLVINPGVGPDQDPRASTRIISFKSTPGFAGAIADLTPAHRGKVRDARRGIALVDRKRVVIQDRVLGTTPSDIWWFMHTPARIDISKDGRSVMLSRGNARLWVGIRGPIDASFKALEAAPLPGSPNPPRQRVNRGIKRLAIHLEKVTDLRLTVDLVPLKPGATPPALPAPRKLEDW